MNVKYFLLAAFICALVALNVYILTGNNPARVCYKDACIIGEKDPVAEIKSLVNSSSNVIILTEGDVGQSQKNALLDGAMIRLSRDFGYKKLTLVTLGLRAGEPTECLCEAQVNATSFANCSECNAAIAPNETTALLKLSYPGFTENRILVLNRTIEFQGKSGEDALALVSEVFERIL